MVGKINESLFNAHEGALEKQERCPECDSALVIKSSKRGPFKACTNYPDCRHIESLHQYQQQIIKELGLPCPKCSGELVLRQGRYGMFIGCSCYPTCQHIEKREQKSPQENEAITCPKCQNAKLNEKISRFGKVFYGCDNYPKCKFVVNQKPITGICEVCGFSLLLEKKESNNSKIKICADKACQHKQ